MSQHRVRRVGVEALVIVTSVFAALMAEAWWSQSQDRQAARQHLVSLERDLDQMWANADTVIQMTTQAVGAGQRLFTALSGPRPEEIADSAITLMAQLHAMRAFSPSLGGYEALLASGHFELVGSAELRLGIVELYGSLDLIRARELEVRAAAQALTGSQPFLDMVGFDRMLPAYVGVLVGADGSEVAAWAQSSELKSHIGLLYGQMVVSLQHYEELSRRLEALREQLPDEP